MKRPMPIETAFEQNKEFYAKTLQIPFLDQVYFLALPFCLLN